MLDSQIAGLLPLNISVPGSTVGRIQSTIATQRKCSGARPEGRGRVQETSESDIPFGYFALIRQDLNHTSAVRSRGFGNSLTFLVYLAGLAVKDSRIDSACHAEADFSFNTCATRIPATGKTASITNVC
jgi:hypothetical protein